MAKRNPPDLTAMTEAEPGSLMIEQAREGLCRLFGIGREQQAQTERLYLNSRIGDASTLDWYYDPSQA